MSLTYCLPDPTGFNCYDSYLTEIGHSHLGAVIGATRICKSPKPLGGVYGFVWQTSTCCITSQSVCQSEMNMEAKRWTSSMFKAGNGNNPLHAIEVEALRELSSTGLVSKLFARVDEPLSVDGTKLAPPMMVIEAIKGEELTDYLLESTDLWGEYSARPSKPAADKIQVKVNCLMRKVLKAIQTIEADGVSHGDAHFGNIFVTDAERDGCREIKFIDFGLAHRLTRNQETGEYLFKDIQVPLAYLDFIDSTIEALSHGPPSRMQHE